MASPKTPAAVAKALVTGLKGVTVVHREATDKLRECWTVRVGKRRVVELLVNVKGGYCRLNVDVPLPAKAIPAGLPSLYVPAKDAKLVWAGGTFSITADNEADGRKIVEAAIEKATATA